MNRFRESLFLALVLGCCLPGTANAANLVLNPGFENNFTNWTGPGWTLTNVAHTGNLAAELDGLDTGGGLYQDIPTTPNQEYLITFYRSGSIPGNLDLDRFQIWFGNRQADHMTARFLTTGYTTFVTFPVRADTSLSRLSFLQVNPVAGSVLRIDDVCVDLNGGACGYSGGVPEPGSWSLILGAGLLFCLYARMRNAASVK